MHRHCTDIARTLHGHCTDMHVHGTDVHGHCTDTRVQCTDTHLHSRTTNKYNIIHAMSYTSLVLGVTVHLRKYFLLLVTRAWSSSGRRLAWKFFHPTISPRKVSIIYYTFIVSLFSLEKSEEQPTPPPVASKADAGPKLCIARLRTVNLYLWRPKNCLSLVLSRRRYLLHLHKRNLRRNCPLPWKVHRLWLHLTLVSLPGMAGPTVSLLVTWHLKNTRKQAI